MKNADEFYPVMEFVDGSTLSQSPLGDRYVIVEADGTVKHITVHQAIKMYMANERTGTATKCPKSTWKERLQARLGVSLE